MWSIGKILPAWIPGHETFSMPEAVSVYDEAGVPSTTTRSDRVNCKPGLIVSLLPPFAEERLSPESEVYLQKGGLVIDNIGCGRFPHWRNGKTSSWAVP